MGEREVAGVRSTVTGGAGIILDRDGTLIDVFRDEETGVISTAFHPNQIRVLSGVIAGLHALRDAGYAFAIATNQPGPAKGQFSAAAVKRTNDALVELLAKEGITIASVKACIHHPDGGPGGDASLVGPCACRKPKAGMLEEIIAELGWSREASWMVGDSAADVEAGALARMRTALVFPSNRCELCPLRPSEGGLVNVSRRAVPDVHASTLDKVAAKIVAFASA